MVEVIIIFNLLCFLCVIIDAICNALEQIPQKQKKVQPRKLYPKKLYHGTEKEFAYEIYNTGLFLIGDSVPPAIYMTDDFDIAKEFSGKGGGIVVIEVAPEVQLTKYDEVNDNTYIYEIPGAKPYEEYYQIPGLNPIGILDSKQKLIEP